MANPTLNMNLSLTHRLRNRASGAAYRNQLWGAYCAQPDRPGVYYVERKALRNFQYADEVVSLRHTGWFTDREFQDDTMRGVIAQLPARDGKAVYIAGYQYTGGDDTGGTFYFNDLHDTDKEAARMADEHARVAAEEECDYQEAERAKLAAEEAKEARLDNLAACHPPLHVEMN